MVATTAACGQSYEEELREETAKDKAAAEALAARVDSGDLRDIADDCTDAALAQAKEDVAAGVISSSTPLGRYYSAAKSCFMQEGMICEQRDRGVYCGPGYLDNRESLEGPRVILDDASWINFDERWDSGEY